MAETGAMDQVATALSPNGKLAALGGGFTYKNGVLGFGGGLRTRPLRVIDVATGREVESFKLAGDLSSPTDLSFSPDSRLIVAKFVERGARDASMRSWLSVFDVASGRELKKLPSTDALGMGGIAFSPDGKLLASRVNAVSDSALAGSVNLIDTGTWREVRSLAKTGFDMSLGLATAARRRSRSAATAAGLPRASATASRCSTPRPANGSRTCAPASA